MTTAPNYIGRGLRVPFGVDHRGAIASAGGIDLIEMSIWMILSTAPGERVMRPTFGCAIWNLVFAPVTFSNLAQMKDAVAEALLHWEPRIQVIDVEADSSPEDPSRVDIEILYEVLATNDRRNLVYPFYVIPREPGTPREETP